MLGLVVMAVLVTVMLGIVVIPAGCWIQLCSVGLVVMAVLVTVMLGIVVIPAGCWIQLCWVWLCDRFLLSCIVVLVLTPLL